MFKKRESIDILDIPELSRRKIIKLPETEKQEETKITKDGFFDFSQNKTNNSNIDEKKGEVKETETPISNFFNDLPSFNNLNQSINLENKTEPENNDEVKGLKWRMENLEFKLEQLIEKVNSINIENQSQ